MFLGRPHRPATQFNLDRAVGAARRDEYWHGVEAVTCDEWKPCERGGGCHRTAPNGARIARTLARRTRSKFIPPTSMSCSRAAARTLRAGERAHRPFRRRPQVADLHRMFDLEALALVVVLVFALRRRRSCRLGAKPLDGTMLSIVWLSAMPPRVPSSARPPRGVSSSGGDDDALLRHPRGRGRPGARAFNARAGLSVWLVMRRNLHTPSPVTQTTVLSIGLNDHVDRRVLLRRRLQRRPSPSPTASTRASSRARRPA